MLHTSYDEDADDFCTFYEPPARGQADPWTAMDKDLAKFPCEPPGGQMIYKIAMFLSLRFCNMDERQAIQDGTSSCGKKVSHRFLMYFLKWYESEDGMHLCKFLQEIRGVDAMMKMSIENYSSYHLAMTKTTDYFNSARIIDERIAMTIHQHAVPFLQALKIIAKTMSNVYPDMLELALHPATRGKLYETVVKIRQVAAGLPIQPSETILPDIFEIIANPSGMLGSDH